MEVLSGVWIMTLNFQAFDYSEQKVDGKNYTEKLLELFEQKNERACFQHFAPVDPINETRNCDFVYSPSPFGVIPLLARGFTTQ